jgi:hypothetical protein
MLDLFVMHDANGNYVCSHDRDELAELFDLHHSEPSAPVAIYVVELERPTPTPEAIKGKLVEA